MPDKLDVKPGERVAIRRGMSEHYSVFTVKEIGARGRIILNNGLEFKSDGTPMKSNSAINPIQKMTEEIEQAIEKHGLINQLAALGYSDWRKLSLEQLKAIVKIIEEGNNAPENN